MCSAFDCLNNTWAWMDMAISSAKAVMMAKLKSRTDLFSVGGLLLIYPFTSFMTVLLIFIFTNKNKSVVYTDSHLCETVNPQISLCKEMQLETWAQIQGSTVAQWCVMKLRLRDHGKGDGIFGRLPSHMLYACSVWPVTCVSRLQLTV